MTNTVCVCGMAPGGCVYPSCGAKCDTETEQFWKGEFGDEYTRRNVGLVESNTAFFANVLARTHDIQSVIEYGAGTGQNLVAINRLLPKARLLGVEINEQAASEIPLGEVLRKSMLDIDLVQHCADLTFTKGVLIHIAPEDLPLAYDVLHATSRQYVVVAEYYNPKPVEVEYRGHAGKLWKRDFAGEILDRFDDLTLVDYGFTYHKDRWPQDDITWFLMEKKP